MTASQPAWPWRRGPARTLLTLPPSAAQYGCSVSAAVTVSTHCTGEKTVLQRAHFSRLYLRIRD